MLTARVLYLNASTISTPTQGLVSRVRPDGASVQLQSVMINAVSMLEMKPVFGDSDLVRHKLGCTATEDG